VIEDVEEGTILVLNIVPLVELMDTTFLHAITYLGLQ
jgi:hypothetical protein